MEGGEAGVVYNSVGKPSSHNKVAGGQVKYLQLEKAPLVVTANRVGWMLQGAAAKLTRRRRMVSGQIINSVDGPRLRVCRFVPLLAS